MEPDISIGADYRTFLLRFDSRRTGSPNNPDPAGGDPGAAWVRSIWQ